MLRLQTLRVVFDCKSNVLDAYNLEFSKKSKECSDYKLLRVVSGRKNRMPLMLITVKSEHFPTLNFQKVERMLRLQTLRVVFDCKSNVLDAYNLERMLRLQTLRVVFDCKSNVLDAYNLEKMLRLQTLRVVFDCKSNVLDAYNLEFSKRFLKFFLFVSLYNITSRKNAPITNFEGGFRLQIEGP
ncbi:hypothetical protein AGLY_016805 [Aphis glycines]|uniref:Uncharacterized protein n=1 Tax=Aphis glycines TaxID=307491 RepID=A0A6G0SWP6_APHGL|nr:hypothetical protein AGLY_016805 [Aphis glycines]